MSSNCCPSSSAHGRIRLSVVAVFLFSICIPTVVAGQSDDLSEMSRRELARAAAIAGTPLAPNTEPQNIDFDQAWSRLRFLYDYRDMNIRDQRLATAWFSIQQEDYKCLLILSRIAQIDNAKPSGLELFVKTFRENKTEEAQTDAGLTILKRLIAEGNKNDLEAEFRVAVAKLQDSIAALGRVGDALPGYRRPNAVAIAYWPSWRGVYRADVLEVTNTSGVDIDNATVVATVHDANGSSRVHVHSVDHWSSGSVVASEYAYEGTDYANPQAVANPSSVDVSVYAPSMVTSASYLLTEAEWSRIVEAYCSHLKFSGNFLGPYVDADSNRHPSGVQFSFTGLKRLRVQSVTVRFWTSEDESQAVIFQIEPADQMFEAGQMYPYRSPLFEGGDVPLPPGSNPQHIRVTLEFPGTSYRKDIRIY